jgi:hypothetical protein
MHEFLNALMALCAARDGDTIGCTGVQPKATFRRFIQ